MKTKLLFLFLFTAQLCMAQDGKKTIPEIFDDMKIQNYTSYFEVNDEMFKMLAESKEATPEFKEYVSKLQLLRMVQSEERKLYKMFMINTNLKSFDKLMTRKDKDETISFYKRERNGYANEFLLVSDEVIIYVSGKIDLTSIGEFENIMDIAGSAFDM